MANQDVRITVSAEDKASGILAQLAQRLTQLGKSSSEVETRAGELAAKMRAAGSTFQDIDKQAMLLAQHEMESAQSLKALAQETQNAEQKTDQLAQAQTRLGGSLLGNIAKVSAVVFGLRTFLQSTTSFIQGSIRAASEYQVKLIGLTTASNNFGISQNDLTNSIQSLTNDGLLNQAQAMSALSNLTASYVTNTDDAVNLISMFKDFAASGGDATKSLGDKVIQLSEAFLTEMSILGNNAGMQENWNEIIKVGEDITGKKYESLNKLEKQQLKIAGVTAIHARAQGSANEFMETGIGRIQMMKNNMQDLQVQLGNALLPSLGQLAAAFNSSTTGGQVLQTAIKGIGSVALGVTLMIRSLTTAIGQMIQSAKALVTFNLNEFSRLQQVHSQEMLEIWADAQQDLEGIWNDEIGGSIQDTLGQIPDWAEQAGQETQKKMQRIAEDLRKEQERFALQAEKMTRDFRRSLADLVFAHREKVDSIKRDLEEETQEFQKQNEKRERDLERSLEKMEKAHTRKVRDINRDVENENLRHAEARERIEQQIRDEARKGIVLFGQFQSQADQERLAELRTRLSEEDAEHQRRLENLQIKLTDEQEDYKESLATKKEIFKEETTEARKQHEERKSDLDTALQAEQQILEQHADLVASVKELAKENDIERLMRQHEEEKQEAERAHAERVEDLKKQANEAGTTYGSGFKAPVVKSAEETKNEFESQMSKLSDNLKAEGEKAGKGWVQKFFGGLLDKARDFKERLGEGGFRALFPQFGAMDDLSRIIHGQSMFQHGGIVPGSPTDQVPIIAHGGERIIPKTGVDVNQRTLGSGGANITINMTGPVTMRSDDDIRMLAEQVIKTIGRRNELERLGVGS